MTSCSSTSPRRALPRSRMPRSRSSFRSCSEHVAGRIETTHGEEIASLFDIYVGRAHVYYNPKIRLERLIYRGIREAANAAKGVEERERARRVDDLQTKPSGSRGLHRLSSDSRRGHAAGLRLRSARARHDAHAAQPGDDVRCRCRGGPPLGAGPPLPQQGDRGHEVAPEARRAAVHERRPARFHRSAFNEIDREVVEPHRVVIEITERTAIKDYPKFRERLKALSGARLSLCGGRRGQRLRGARSIANLEPDFIKLDISLINCIDTNFIKQNLVETMVRFANDQGAKVIAEGVERAEEYETVKGLGVHLVQGFFLHRPSEHAVARTGETAAVRPEEVIAVWAGLTHTCRSERSRNDCGDDA